MCCDEHHYFCQVHFQLHFQFTEPCDTPVYVDELDCAVPEGVWRIGRPCEGDNDNEEGGEVGPPQRIFMALAPFVSDAQLSPQNLKEKNMELRKSQLETDMKGNYKLSLLY